MNKYCDRCGSKLKHGYCPICDIKEHNKYSHFRDAHLNVERNISFKNIVWTLLLAMIITLSVTISVVYEIPYTESIGSDLRSRVTDEGLKISRNVYDHVKYPLANEGEQVTYTLSAGNYLVGEDIAEGTYQIENLVGFSHFGVRDYENRISINESLTTKGDDDTYFTYQASDVRLYKGAVLNIDSNSMELRSTNANTADIKEMQLNPLTLSHRVTHTILIGESSGVSEGFYDIEVIEGEGDVDSGFDDFGIYGELTTDTTNEYGVSSFRNVYLKEYDRLSIDEGLVLELKPSKYIRTRREK